MIYEANIWTIARRPWWETRTFAAVMISLAVIPLLYPALPPLVDLPDHMARYRIALDGGRSPSLSAYYTFRWSLTGNLGVDLLILPVAKLFGLEAAVKLVAILIPTLTVTGLLWVAREVHGRLPPTAAFALPFAYGYPFLFGFLNYTLSVALALLAFAWWLCLSRRGSFKLRNWLFVPISLLIWLCHVLGWGVLGLLVLAAETVRAKEASRTWRQAAVGGAARAMVLAAPMILLLLWRSDASGETIWPPSLVWKIKIAIYALRDRWMLFDVASVGVVLVVLLAAMRSRKVVLSPKLAACGLLLGLAVLVTPKTVFGAGYADARLVPIAFAMLLLSIGEAEPGTRSRLSMWLAVAGVAFVLLRTVGVTASLAIAANEQRMLLTALDNVPQGARVATMVGTRCRTPRWPMERNLHLGGMVVVRRDGFSNTHWEMPGSQLLTVRHDRAQTFRYDPSQFVRSADPACEKRPYSRPIDQAIADIPAGAFDFAWIIQPVTVDPRLIVGWRRVWRASDGSALYRLPVDANRQAP